VTGYRTIIFHLIMGAASLIGLQIAPDTAQHWAGFMVLAWVAGGIVLRFLTTTPAFAKAAATSPELATLANLILAHLPQPDPVATAADPQPASADAPASGGATITGREGAQSVDGGGAAAPPTDLVALATSITNALTTIQSVHAQMANALQVANQTVGAALPGTVAGTAATTAAQ
jgi:hypothetical protein